MLTYGDMMSLLLCFFVLIVSFSQVKTQKYNAVVAALRKALGATSDGGELPLSNQPANSIISMFKELHLRPETYKHQADTNSKGAKGTQPNVKELRRGMRFAIGGPVTFEPGSADLSQQAKAQLKHIAGLVKGYNNIIELRGNATAGELGPVGTRRYKDVWRLSEARAQAVMAYLTGDQIGAKYRLKRDRFRLVADGNNEPLVQRAYGSAAAAPNRRVTVVLSQDLVQQLQGRGGGSNLQNTESTDMTESNDG